VPLRLRQEIQTLPRQVISRHRREIILRLGEGSRKRRRAA
jgi:hypothetical protein